MTVNIAKAGALVLYCVLSSSTEAGVLFIATGNFRGTNF